MLEESQEGDGQEWGRKKSGEGEARVRKGL